MTEDEFRTAEVLCGAQEAGSWRPKDERCRMAIEALLVALAEGGGFSTRFHVEVLRTLDPHFDWVAWLSWLFDSHADTESRSHRRAILDVIERAVRGAHAETQAALDDLERARERANAAATRLSSWLSCAEQAARKYGAEPSVSLLADEDQAA